MKKYQGWGNLLADRLAQVRYDLFGTQGAAEMARAIGLPRETWLNYEAGVTMPAHVLLRFLELTGASPEWLLYGRGRRYRARSRDVYSCN